MDYRDPLQVVRDALDDAHGWSRKQQAKIILRALDVAGYRVIRKSIEATPRVAGKIDANGKET